MKCNQAELYTPNLVLVIIYDITLFLAITSILSYILLISISLLFLSAISKENVVFYEQLL